MLKSRAIGYTKYIKRNDLKDTIPIIKKIPSYMHELIEECLHRVESKCDLVKNKDRVKTSEKLNET